MPLLAPAYSFGPHLHTLDGQAPSVTWTPGWVPLCLTIPELLGGGVGCITPWLVSDTIFEESICSTDSNVEDEEEILVEGRVRLSCL
jgi:hypothetical protein